MEATPHRVVAPSFRDNALQWNRGAEIIFDPSRDEAVGQSFKCFAPPWVFLLVTHLQTTCD
jgi:hypothetical protein